MTVEEAIKFLKQLYPNGGHCWLDEQRIEAIGMAIAALGHEKPVSDDLMEAAEEFRKKIRPLYESMRISTGEPVSAYDQNDMVAMFKAGDQWHKEQMMKDAIALKINRDTLYDLKPIIHEKYLDYKIGDKVKVIIVKEE